MFEPTPDEIDADNEGEHEAVRVDESGESDAQTIAKRFFITVFMEHDEEDDGEREEAITASDDREKVEQGEGEDENDALVKL